MNILKLNNIAYSKNNTNILQNINLTINKGDCISIVGQSGSGKSTILKLCSDLISPTQGNIEYNQQNYQQYDPITLRQKISYCIQTPYLFGKTVYDNLTYPFVIRKEPIDKNKILQLMNKFNIDINYLNKDIHSLSGGEKQRIALIRNLMFTPDILLLDEVTSALDNENAQLIENIIQEMNKQGTTILWVTHNLDQSKSIFNKRITVEQGKIINEETLK